MLHHIKLLVFAVCLTTSCFAQDQSERQQVQDVVRRIFEGFSNGSFTMIGEAVTPDVKILESGEVWTLDTIAAYFRKPRPADFKRTNKLDFFQTEVEGRMAFVSYHNIAMIHANGKDRIVKWLESAVLVKEDSAWKVKMLHSTRLEPE